jgi:hypothetical protein
MFFHHSDLAYKVRVDNLNPMYARMLQSLHPARCVARRSQSRAGPHRADGEHRDAA